MTQKIEKNILYFAGRARPNIFFFAKLAKKGKEKIVYLEKVLIELILVKTVFWNWRTSRLSRVSLIYNFKNEKSIEF